MWFISNFFRNRYNHSDISAESTNEPVCLGWRSLQHRHRFMLFTLCTGLVSSLSRCLFCCCCSCCGWCWYCCCCRFICRCLDRGRLNHHGISLCCVYVNAMLWLAAYSTHDTLIRVIAKAYQCVCVYLYERLVCEYRWWWDRCVVSS